MQRNMATWSNLLVALIAISTGHTGICNRLPNHVNLATFNAGLTPRVPEYAIRRNSIGPKLQTLQADVVCLQEVWFSSDMHNLLSSIGQRYPYTYSDLHESVGAMVRIGSQETPCGTHEFDTEFLQCLTTQCNSASGQAELLTCAGIRCNMMGLEQQCITCLVLSDPETAIQRCRYIPGNRFNVPGLVLLSDLPIQSVSVTRFEPGRNLLLPRSYISAEIEGVGTVACTHTTANLGPAYFEVLPYPSWEEQNLAEARKLVESLQHSDHAVVMGDLNSSPSITTTEVSADFPAHYQYFLDHGYQAPYTELLGVCTWCLYNPVAMAQRNLLLDHVLLKNHYPLLSW